MPTPQFDPTILETLHDQTRGPVLQPGDEGYDEARTVWNDMADRRPAAIVRCTGAADVIASVNVAREYDLLLSVKGGGHSVAGKAVCEGGLMLDLSPMNSVRVDPEAKTARVGPGATWGTFDHETQAFGLATTGGMVSSTGVAGLTLGGGIGWLARTHGLSLDSLLAADAVTAEGELVRASEDENPDLFWGLRGGSGNFSVVTSFEFQLHEVGPEVITAQAFHPIEAARETLRFYSDFSAKAPDEVACYAMIVHVPPVAPFPEDTHGKPAVALVACYSGDVEEGEPLLAPLQDFGDPILAAIQPMPYTVFQQSFDAGTPKGERYYWKSHYLDALPDEAIDTLIDHAASLPGPFTVIGIEPMGGAISRVDSAATAFRHREAMYSLGIWAGWSDPANDDEMIAWTRAFHEAMAPYATGGVYANYLDQDDAEKVKAAYGDNYDRLVEIKQKWDPANLFRMNQNIEPPAPPVEPDLTPSASE